GYEPDSGFDIKLSVENLQLPDPAHAAGAMSEILGKLHRHYRPEGAIDLDATFQRIADGNVLFEGTTELKGLSLTYRGLPYRLDDMRGLIEFTTDRAVFRGVTGRRRGGTFTARGEFSLRGDGKYDVTIDAEDVAFDEQLRKSLPKAYLWVWETLNPAGRALATLQLHSGGEKGRVDVTLKADGKLSFTYSKFPYRVDNIVGDVQITAEKVEVRSVEGSRGAVQCRIDGVIEGINTPQPKTDLTIVARNLPLDETLAAALPAKSRSAFRSLNTSGRADKVTAHVTQAAGKPLDYNILVNIKDVDFKLDAFPYAITGAEGLLTVRPERIIVERLRGRHGRASVLASGQVFTTAENLGIDLQVEMGGLVLDKEFLAALPPAVKKVWDDLSPAGRADMVLSIQQNTPARPGELDYRLVIKPKDMQITYKYFPYRFRVISGEAIVRPGRIELKDLAARTGQMRTSVRGTIESDETGQRAELTVIGRNVPIDAELLAAMPKVLAPLAGRFESGGMCNIDLNKFLFARAAPAEVVGQPAEASSQPSEADGEDPHVAWAVSGTVELKDAMVDIGFAGKKFTGKISGTAARTGKELAIDADVAFESVRVGHHEIIDLKGRLLKGRRSTLLQLLDFSGKAHGGQLAGTVEIRLGEPLQYGLSMVVEDVKLEELFDAGLKDSDKSGKSGKSEEITGLLQGKLEFTAVANDNAKRRATGFVTITKGRMYKLPVLLGLLHVVYLSSPSDAAFTEGYIEYELRGEKLIFTEIHLNGAVLSVVGSGTMDTRTEAIKLNFLAGPPG
ncbi:MAG: hypothetical protein KAU28_02890, partial [Phycisphaerae bacterium]|nr:hypothetical protein [Phycisphaerae bacterium]